MDFTFEWGKAKARSNARKHKVTFEEAVSVFDDVFLLTYLDEDHSEEEERFISIGQSELGRTLLVVHTDRGDVIRIISCRKATQAEREEYEQ